MSFVVRACIAGIVIVAAVIAARLGPPRVPTTMGAHRWFVPGALGVETGRDEIPADSGRGFVTRAMSGLVSGKARDWGDRNGLTPALAFSHNLTRVFPPKLFARHPEFFPLADGKRLRPPEGSYFWNPDIARDDVARFAADAARAHFTAHPDAVSFALGVNDALIWGESPELLALATPTKWFRERPDYSTVVFTFMNRTAAALSRTHPQKYLGALAYYWAENTPPFPLHPQVIPFLTADRAQGYDPEFWAEERELQKKWGVLAGAAAASAPDGASEGDKAAARPPRRLGIYDYVYGGGFLIPRIHTRLMAEHLRHAREVGFTDYYAEVNPNWGLDGPMPWLTAQLVANAALDSGALLNEYYARYFQTAAAPMRRFFERCEEQWMTQPGPSYWLKHYRNESQAVVFPPAVCRELRELLDEAAHATRRGKIAARVRLVSDAFGVTERFVAFQTARNRLSRAVLTSQPRPSIAADLKDYLNCRHELVSYTDRLRKQVPLALHPFDWSDYLKSDPVPAALFALRRAGVHGLEPTLDALLQADAATATLWPKIQREHEGGSARVEAARELLHDPGMAGPLQPARMIARMAYGVSLPAGWQSKVEPAQFHRAELTSRGATRVLRIEGTKDTMISQWTAVAAGELHHAAISVRGHVSPSTAVTLVFAFLDAAQKHVGFKAVRLPDGNWPEDVTLEQAADAPKAAAWVGVGLRVQNQVKGDWLEARNFSLKVEGPP